MKRTHPLSTAALLGATLLAAPALAQRHDAGGGVPSSATTPQNRGAAEVDRMHKGNGANGGPAELLLRAQSAMRNGQTLQATELLERAETRLLTGVEPSKPGGGEPAFHVSEARRALTNRDRAEAMRHTNMAIATVRDAGGVSTTGGDAAGGGGRATGGGGPGAVDSGMGTLPRSGAVVRDAGAVGTRVSRAEGVVLAQSGTGGGRAPTGLPPGDSLPGWSGPRGGAQGQGGGATAPRPGAPAQQDGGAGGLVPDSFSRRGTSPLDFSSPLSGPGSSGITGGSPARVGGAPPSDTSRAPGSSGIGPSGPTGLGAAGPGPLR